jgi:sulfite reductase beta subunit-like hemoprotein
VDTGGLAQAVSDMYRAGGKEFSNLPRKIKTAIGGCRLHCHEPQINDLGFFGATRQRRGRVEAGLGLLVGGGLRDTPHFGQSLRVFLPPDTNLVKDVARGVANLFRDADELRRGRLRARLKFLVEKIGWEAFRDRLEKRLGYALEHDEGIVYPLGASHGDHMGVGEQVDGRCYVGVPTARGRLAGDDMIGLADLAEEFAGSGKGLLVITIKQNVMLLNIPADRVDELSRGLEERGLRPQAHPLRGSLLSCTGLEFCRLAVVETKQRAAEVLDYLERKVELDEPIMISVTGCPNSCVQYQIADIGLHGVPVVHQGRRQEGFQFLVGGKIGSDPRFARFVVNADGKKLKVPASGIRVAIEKLLTSYKARKRPGESFADWAQSLDMTELAGLVGSHPPSGASES